MTATSNTEHCIRFHSRHFEAMASYLPNLARDNISLHAIPIAWFIALSPRFWAVNTYFQLTGKDMNIKHPRTFIQEVNDDQNPNLDDTSQERIGRAEAAMDNGFDNVALYAAAVCAGNIARLDAKWLNGLALGYMASRMLYNVLYIYNDTKQLAKARAGVFMCGMAMIFTLFVRAGEKLRKA